MTFAWPFMLFGLALVPILVALDLLSRRRRARYAVAFTNIDVLRSVVPRVPPWRRYLPLVFLLVALTVLIVGLARPQRAISVARKQATVTLVMDTSGSMVAQDVAPTRLGAATTAAGQFIDDLPRSYRVGLVPFSSTATVAVAPTFNHTAVETALRSLHADGGTAIGDAISLALAVGRPSGERPGAPPPDRTKGSGRVILLLSDGANTSGMDPLTAAAQAKAEGVKVYTVAFGTANGVVSAGPYGQIVSVPPDPTTLKAVAQATGGEFFAAADADTLRRVYKHIGSQVGTTKQHEDVSYAFAGIGAVLLTAAGLLSTLWRGQIT